MAGPKYHKSSFLSEVQTVTLTNWVLAMKESAILGTCILISALIVSGAILYAVALRPVSDVGRYQFQASSPPGILYVMDATTGTINTQ